MIDRIETRPEAPAGCDNIWYRGWECGWNADAAYWGDEPWYAYKGGADLDAPQVTGKTWEALLDEIDAEEGDD